MAPIQAIRQLVTGPGMTTPQPVPDTVLSDSRATRNKTTAAYQHGTSASATGDTPVNTPAPGVALPPFFR